MSPDVPEQSPPSFQWNWVAVSLVVYLIFYFFPLMLVPGGIIGGGLANEVTLYVVGIWGIAGIFVISAVMAYFSKGITVWEAVVSAFGVVLLMVVSASLELRTVVLKTSDDYIGFGIALVVVFAMSYMGAWWGEKLQNAKELVEQYPLTIEGLEDDRGKVEEGGDVG